MPRAVFIVPISLLAALAGCSNPPPVSVREVDTPRREKQALVAHSETRFNNLLVEKIVRKLAKQQEDDPVHIRVIALDRLRARYATDYTAVVIVQRAYASHLGAVAREFMKRFPHPEKVVLVLSVTSVGFQYRGPKAETVICKPDLAGADRVADDVVKKVTRILEKK